MRVKTSLDWERESVPLISQMHAAPRAAQHDLAKMLGHITVLVHELSREEVELRRCKKFNSPRSLQLLAEINNSINEYEKWLMFAQLSLG